MKQSNKTRQKKRKLVDEKFTDIPAITSLEELPPREYDITEYVSPVESDMNEDSSIIFQITTQENEFFYFNRYFQAALEMSITEQKYKQNGDPDKVELLVKKQKPAPTDTVANPPDPNNFAFVSASSGLSIFKNISVSYMNHTKDESLTFPQEGVFLNNLAAQDIFLSGSERFENTQNSLNNFSTTNILRLGEQQDYIPDDIQKMRFSKLHKSKTDAPFVPGVPDTSATSVLVGKMHYMYIPRTPFVANSPYLQNKFRMQGVMIFPPNSTVRIVFYKTDTPLKYLGINSEVDMNKQSNNTPATGTTWVKKDLDYYIHNMHLVIHRIKLQQKQQIPTRYLSNITVNHFDLVELTSATSQKIPINWRSTDTPAYIVLCFVRQQDVIFNENHGLPQSVNQFYLPQYLDKITIRKQDYINEVFDGLKLENLHEQDYHKSKLEYIEYLKKHGFVTPDFKFTDMFSIDNSIGTGCCNLFPISLVGRDIQADPLNRGLEVELSYTQSNSTKWFLAKRFVFIGQQVLTRQADKQYKVDFKYH